MKYPGRRVMGQVILADNMDVMPGLPDASFALVYMDPPFNTGRTRSHTTLKTVRDDQDGDRRGFGGNRYRSIAVGSQSFADSFDDALVFLEPRLIEARRLLRPDGALFLHMDFREVHYCKVLLDSLFGRDQFMNEIVWAYDYGGRPKRRWPAKHDTILWYVKDKREYTFNYDAIDRIPYMAPGLVDAKKAARGKTPTDVWWQTIVPTNGKERTGYPTQKPIRIIERIVAVHTNEGDRVLDCFAGSGTLGEAAARAGRDFVMIDNNPEAVRVMARRLSFAQPEIVGLDVATSEGPA